MWASRPPPCDDDGPIDLRKKVVLQRDLQEQRCREEEKVIPWRPKPTLPVSNLRPFVSESYGGSRCHVVSPEEHHLSRTGSRGSLETAIRKLHQNNHLRKTSHPTKQRRSRSVDFQTDRRETRSFHRRSGSCPTLHIITPTPPKPAPLKPKSSFIQRSRIDSREEFESTDFHPLKYHHDDLAFHHPVGGARKRKSFVPVYGDRAPPSPKRRSDSPQEEYYSHPEILLRRQLQQHSPSPYFVHVYDYYQQLVQRLREHSSPVLHLPPSVSPPSLDDDLPSDAQRRRPCRALTGKHVRQGTGASLSTLLTLRQKIQERQRAKEHPRSLLNGGFINKNSCPKKNKAQKSKPNSKSMMSKI